MFTPLLLLIILFATFLYIIKHSTSIITISIAVVLALSYISFTHPFFGFLFMVMISGPFFIIFFPFPIYEGFYNSRKNLINKLLIFLARYDILDFFSVFYILFFFVDRKPFLYRTAAIMLVNCLYIVSSKWYFFHTVFLHDNFSLLLKAIIYILLLSGIAVLYSRVLLNVALTLIPLTIRTDKTLLSPSVLYVFGEGEEPINNPDTGTPGTPKQGNNGDRKYSLFNLNITRNYYKQRFNHTNATTFKYTGLCLGICTAAAAVFTGYQAWSQSSAAHRQADQAQEQLNIAKRQNDFTALQAGLISKEEYYKRHPQDKP
jgi:hypothetical protein